MKFVCSNCGRSMEFAEELSFCPFCGNAYGNFAKAPQTAVNRIVIGSDSERTIQEKYWKQTHSAVFDALNALKASLPRFSKNRDEAVDWDEETPEEYLSKILRVEELSNLAHCTSIAEFCGKMKHIFANVEKEMAINRSLAERGQQYIDENRKISAERRATMERGEWSVEELEDEYSVDIDAEEAFIQQFCTELAENLGNMSSDRLRPELNYDPDSAEEWLDDEEEDDECFKCLPDYALLWEEIQNSEAVVTDALKSNGLFALSLVHGEVYEDFEPKSCVKDLQSLKNRDYDPLFGESPEPLIRAFFDGLANLMAFINSLPDYLDIIEWSPERKLHELKNRLDEIKLDALRLLIRNWSEILTQELDRLYQSQREDMLDVCNGIVEMRKALDETDEGERA